MRKRKIKKTLISIVIGVILGILLSQVTSKLSIQDCLLLASILLILVIVTAAIMAEDLEIRIKKAYLEGKQALNCKCTHTIKTEDK